MPDEPPPTTTQPAVLPVPDDRLVATAERLRGMYDRAGVQQPDELAMAAPELFVGGEKSRPPVQVLARKLAELLSGKQLLFMRGKEIGTINEMSGEWEAMTPHSFATWVPQVAGIVLVKHYDADPKTGKKHIEEGELGVDVSRVILASTELRVRLPVVEQINRVRLPVYREKLDERDDPARKGYRKIELLPEGYDAETKTFTIAGGMSYDDKLEENAAYQWLQHLVRDFQWGDEERSKAVFVQAFLTLFCRNLYLGKSPMFMFTSNLPGSGKSMLTRLCIEPVMGAGTAPSGWNRDDKQETRKELDAYAQDFSPFIWFDDVDRCKVVSSDLNRWLTSSTWACRVMGSKEKFNGPLRAVTFLTGNQVTLDDNLERRTLVVDLFARQQARERVIAADRIELDEEFFTATESNMAKCLAVMWAFVRIWDDYGRNVTKQRPLESFKQWSLCVPSIAEQCGFTKGLAAYESPDSGNNEGREWRELVQALIAEHCTAPDTDRAEISMREVVKCARLHGLFAEKLDTLDSVHRELQRQADMKKHKWKLMKDEEEGLERDPTEAEQRMQAAEWTDKATDSSWAKAWRKSAVAGQHFLGKDGKLYQFGDRTSGKKASKFLLAVVR